MNTRIFVWLLPLTILLLAPGCQDPGDDDVFNDDDDATEDDDDTGLLP